LDCRRTKMLFETEKKALDFIKWNADEVMEETGRKPVRAYHCRLCMGWHLSSKAKPWHGSSIMEKALDTLMQKLTPVRKRIAKKRKDPAPPPPIPAPQPIVIAQKALTDYEIRRYKLMAETRKSKHQFALLLADAKNAISAALTFKSRGEEERKEAKLRLAEEKLSAAEVLLQQIKVLLLTVMKEKEAKAMLKREILKSQNLRKKQSALSL